jgi:alkylated DNA repair dioxygenase AlkB
VVPSLFGVAAPPGFDYTPGLISHSEERDLVAQIQQLAFSDVVMRGAVAKRRTAHFGVGYVFEGRSTTAAPSMPPFLLPLRDRAAAWAERPAEAFVEALVTEYPAGAAIGWHRDAPAFDDVIGVSLLASCRMKLRPYVSPKDLPALAGKVRRTTHEVTLEQRSAYLISGEARTAYEHHIPAVEHLRYSVTFRSLRP